jgi:molecular chaperone GrpE
MNEPANDARQANGSTTPNAPEEHQFRAELERVQAERDRYLDLLQRTRADFENYQKRQARDLEQERRYACSPLMLDLMSALDNLERALGSVKEETTLSKGVAMVQSQLLDALKRHGVTRIEAVDQAFDPHLHQAVMQQDAPDKPANTVLQVLEQGYLHHDRVLRPSRVIVSRNET